MQSPFRGMIEWQTAQRAQLGISAPAAVDKALQDFSEAAFAALEREEAAWQRGAPNPSCYVFLTSVFDMMLLLKPGLPAVTQSKTRCNQAAMALKAALQAGQPCPYIPHAGSSSALPCGAPRARAHTHTHTYD